MGTFSILNFFCESIWIVYFYFFYISILINPLRTSFINKIVCPALSINANTCITNWCVQRLIVKCLSLIYPTFCTHVKLNRVSEVKFINLINSVNLHVSQLFYAQPIESVKIFRIWCSHMIIFLSGEEQWEISGLFSDSRFPWDPEMGTLKESSWRSPWTTWRGISGLSSGLEGIS